MTDEYLTRARMLEVLTLLGERLHAQGIEAQLYVVGGAAVAFAYARDRVTRDIDAIVLPSQQVFAAARELGAELDLPEEWINDTARAFLPEVDIDGGTLVLEVPGISVRSAPAEVLLAMKLLAARAKDVDDIRMLSSLLELTTAAAVWKVFLRYYPEGHLVDHARLLIEEIFPT